MKELTFFFANYLSCGLSWNFSFFFFSHKKIFSNLPSLFFTKCTLSKGSQAEEAEFELD